MTDTAIHCRRYLVRSGVVMMETRVPTAHSREALTLYEIGDLFGLKRTRLYELARKNELPIPVFKVGRTYRASRRVYDELMSATHADSASASDTDRKFA